MNIVNRRVSKKIGKAFDRWIATVSWGIIIIGLYTCVIYRTLRGKEIEEDQQDRRDE